MGRPLGPSSLLRQFMIPTAHVCLWVRVCMSMVTCVEGVCKECVVSVSPCWMMKREKWSRSIILFWHGHVKKKRPCLCPVNISLSLYCKRKWLITMLGFLLRMCWLAANCYWLILFFNGLIAGLYQGWSADKHPKQFHFARLKSQSLLQSVRLELSQQEELSLQLTELSAELNIQQDGLFFFQWNMSWQQ